MIKSQYFAYAEKLYEMLRWFFIFIFYART